MTPLRKALLAVGMGLALYSPASFAQESGIDKLRDLFKRARTKVEETKEKVKEDVAKAKQKLSETKEKIKETLEQTTLREKRELYNSFKLEVLTSATKEVRVYDFEDKEFKSFDTVTRELINKNPGFFEGSDFESNPIRTALGLLYDPDGFKKYKVIGDGSGNWLTMNGAIEYLNQRAMELVKQTGEESLTIPTTRRRDSTQKNRFVPEFVQESKANTRKILDLEGILFREYTLNYPSGEEFKEVLTFGENTINIITYSKSSIEGLPIDLGIICEGPNNTSTSDIVFLTADEQEFANFDLPKLKKEYVIYDSKEGEIRLTILDYTLKRFEQGKAFQQFCFRIKSTKIPELKPVKKPLSLEGKLAFISDRNNRNYRDIFTMDADGSNVRELMGTPRINEDQLAWSPNGEMLAYTVNQVNNNNLYIINADGSGRRIIAKNCGSSTPVSWSPDGRWITYHADLGRGIGNKEIYITSTSRRSRPKRLTHNDMWDIHPAFSPDGKSIALISDRHDNNDLQLYIMDPDGSNPQKITDKPFGDKSYPVWSPDGSMIAFYDRTNIRIVNKNGSEVKKLIGRDYGVCAYGPLAWSPDGKSIVIVSNKYGNNELCLMGIDGSNFRRLTDNHASDSNPSWCPTK